MALCNALFNDFFFKFKIKAQLGDYDLALIHMQLRCSLEEKNDISDNLKDLEQMIEHMLIRKGASVCENLNKENIATFLASCVPTESFEELREKLNFDEDPVSSFFILIWIILKLPPNSTISAVNLSSWQNVGAILI